MERGRGRWNGLDEGKPGLMRVAPHQARNKLLVLFRDHEAEVIGDGGIAGECDPCPAGREVANGALHGRATVVEGHDAAVDHPLACLPASLRHCRSPRFSMLTFRQP